MKNYFKPLLEERKTLIFAEKIANDGLTISVPDDFFIGGETGEEDAW